MASTVIRELVAKLGVDADDKAINAFDKGLNTVKNTMFALVAAAGAATAAVFAITQATANRGDAAAKSADATGLEVEAYQEIAAAAGKADVEVSRLDTAMQRQASTAQTAAESNKGFIETANGTKISVLDTTGAIKTQEQLFLDVADAVQAAATEQEKLAIVTAVYGRTGGELLPLLANGAEGINALREEYRLLGGVISEEAARESEAFNDALTDLKTILTGVRNEIGTALIPIFKDVALSVKDWYLANKELVTQRVDRFVSGLVTTVQFLIDAFNAANGVVMSTFGSWLPVISLVAAAIAGLIAALSLPTIISVGTAISSVVSVLSSIGLPAIVAIAGAVAYLVGYFVTMFLVLQDLYTFINGGDSILGRMLEQFTGTETVIGAIIDTVDSLLPLLSELWTLVQTLGQVWYFVFSNTSLPLLQMFAGALMFVGGVMGFVFGEYVQFVLGNLTLLFDTLTYGIGLLNQFIAFVSDAESRASALAGLAGGILGGVGLGGLTGGLFAPSSESEANPGAGNTTNTSIGGNTYIVQGTGISADEAQRIFDEAEEERNRNAEAITGGIEV